MANPEFIAKAEAVDLTDQTSITCDKPTGTADSDLMIAVITAADDLVTLSAPIGWTEIFQYHEDVVLTDRTFAVFYKVASSEGSNYSFSSSGAIDMSIAILTYRNINIASPLAVAWNTSNHIVTGTTAASNNIQCPDIVLTGPAMVITGVSRSRGDFDGVDSVWAGPSGFSLRYGTVGADAENVQQSVADKYIASAMTVEPGKYLDGNGAETRSTSTWIIALAPEVVYDEDLTTTITSEITETDLQSYIENNQVTAVAAVTLTESQVTEHEMYDYLDTVTAGVDITLNIKPHVILPYPGKKAQIVHKKDDGSIKAYTISSYSYFDVEVQWTSLTRQDSGFIFDLWHNPAKANGYENTFYWEHPVDGHTYVARFMSELTPAYVAGWGADREKIETVTLRVEGKKADS